MKASRRAADRKRLAASKQSAEERRRLAADLSALRRMQGSYRGTSAAQPLLVAELSLYALLRGFHRGKCGGRE